MYINLSDLKEIGEKKSVTIEVEFHDLNFGGREIEINDAVNLNLDIYNTQDSYLIEGTIKAVLVLTCSRCLEKYESPTKIDISEEISKSDMEDQDELFIDEIIVDNIILSLPIKTLCSETCKGLCPICGQNLNKGDCDCEVDNIDPRLQKLKDFYDK
ncbi:MAG: YceD family protein [Halanaerobium sp.]